MNVTPTVSEVIAKLRTLGSGRQIADFLASEKVVGLPGMRMACPLANYLIRETDESIAVSTDSIRVGFLPPYTHIDTTGTPVQDFVHQFDFGQYPELIANPEMIAGVGE